ncbi:MAG: AbrB/MazE/SpoVT family DNA-binding domain-containing protein [Candidatus Woesearchaeota archaeon]
MNVAITRMSSKGQVVIPADMRTDIDENTKLIIIQNDNQLIMKKVDDLTKNLEEDLAFAKKTEEAFKRYEKGGFIEKDSKEFLKELEKW